MESTLTSSSVDVVVACQCGTEQVVANPRFVDTINCRTCRRLIHMDRVKQTPVKSVGPSYSALVAGAMKAEPRARASMAVQFVREGKYEDAIVLYKSLMRQEFIHRDTVYGLGFCYYKLAAYEDSKFLLGLAAEMEHPGAAKLLQKIHELSSTGD